MFKLYKFMSELYTPIPDSFERERPLQPKRVIGDYVESQGLLVPQRFDTFEEAQFAAENGIPVLARSEHPHEYSGPSGLGTSSPFVESKDGSMKPAYQDRGQDPEKLYMHYIMTSGEEEPVSYLSKLSESYWQSIPGINVTAIADDVVEGRYHIFGHRPKGEPGSMPSMVVGAVVEENGDILRINRWGEDNNELSGRFKEIVDFYNHARQLGRFNLFHCPAMEIQVSDEDDKLYFLQYHRTRDAAPSDERLNPAEYDEREGWVKADAVRGALLGAKSLELAIWYERTRQGRVQGWRIELPDDGSTSVDYTYSVLDEFIGRQRIAHLISSSFDNEYNKLAANHGPRSRMFKPQVSVLTDPGDRYEYIPKELRKEANELGLRENKEVRIRTDVASDGRTGYFRYSDELVVAK